MSGCIAGTQYMPSVEYFAHWMHHGHLTIDKQEHYQKRTWRNKTAILGPEECLLLTIPLEKGKHQQMAIDAVRISYDELWQKAHLNSLKTAYGKTAFFDEVLPGLETIYQTDYETLWNLNHDFTRLIVSMLSGTWTCSYTVSYIHNYGPEMIDLRKGVPCGTSTLPSTDIPQYAQVQRLHKTHQPNLCILDALCHLGPGTREYLGRYADNLYKPHDEGY